MRQIAFQAGPLRQQGLSLIVVLMMVLLVTMVGIAGVRTLVMQERMAANSFDRTLALQSAERVLRNAEAIAKAQSLSAPMNIGFPASTPIKKINGTYVPSTASCTVAPVADASPCNSSSPKTGLCSQPETGCLARWNDASFNGWADVASVAASGAASQNADAALAVNLRQQYIIEFLGTNFPCSQDKTAAFNCTLYRITVRTNANNTDRAMVILQSNYLAEP